MNIFGTTHTVTHFHRSKNMSMDSAITGRMNDHGYQGRIC